MRPVYQGGPGAILLLEGFVGEDNSPTLLQCCWTRQMCVCWADFEGGNVVSSSSDDMSSASPTWRRDSMAQSLVGARSSGSSGGGDYSGNRGSAPGGVAELFGSSFSEQSGSR